MFNVEKIREDFPILKRKINGKQLVYLDNAATTQKPKQVIQAIVEYYENHNANIHRGIHTLADEATQMYENSREKVKKFISARSEKEIIFVRNSTEGINLVAYSWGMRNVNKGDEILLTDVEHHSNLVPWQFVAKARRAKLSYLKARQDGTVSIQDFENAINKKTKIIAINHISNVLGVINPIKEMAKIAHDNGSLILVDGSQSVPRIPTDVRDMDCDFLVFTGHKILGPTGIGILYGNERILEDMEPFLGGGDMIKEVWLDRASWNDLPHKFEAGTPNIAGSIGLGAALDYLSKVGMKDIKAHEDLLTQYTLDEIQKIPGIQVLGPLSTEKKTGLVSFTMKGIHPHDIATILNEDAIAVRSGQHCAMPLHVKFNIPASTRASFYLYNTKEEVDKLVNSLKKVSKVFS